MVAKRIIKHISHRRILLLIYSVKKAHRSDGWVSGFRLWA